MLGCKGSAAMEWGQAWQQLNQGDSKVKGSGRVAMKIGHLIR